MGCISSSSINSKQVLLTSPGRRSSTPIEFDFKIKKAGGTPRKKEKLETIKEAVVHLEWTESFK